MLLIEGLSNSQGGLLDSHDSSHTVSMSEDIYITSVENLLSHSVLGSQGNYAQYKIPKEKKRGEPTKIGTVSMENYQMHKVIDSLDNLIEKSVSTKRKEKAQEKNY